MKKISFDKMTEMSGGLGGADCALAVGGAVVSTLLLGAAVMAAPASGGVSVAAAWGFFGGKLLSYAGIFGACRD